MAVRVYLRNMTDANKEIADVGITVLTDILYDLRNRPSRLVAESIELPAAVQADELRLVALNQTTEYAVDTAIAILSGANPDDPLTWGAHVIPAQYFRERFTFAEQVSIVSATHTDDEVKNFYDHLHMSRFVDLTKQTTETGLDLLIAKQLLEADRKAVILAV